MRLRAPYTFTVTGLLILIGEILSGIQMAKDIFPAINIPVVGVNWMYNGLPAQEMEHRITTVSERAFTTNGCRITVLTLSVQKRCCLS